MAHLLLGKAGDVGRLVTDNRLFINAVLWINRSGVPWRDLPERFGPWKRSGVPVNLPPIPTLGQDRRLAKRLRGLTGAQLRLADDRLDHRAGASIRSRAKNLLKLLNGLQPPDPWPRLDGKPFV